MIKNPNYLKNFSKEEKKSFNHWAILNGLSQDENVILICAFLWKDGYYDKIPSEHFYTLLCKLIPKSDKKVFWNKSKKKNNKLLKCLSQWYGISTRESEDYLSILLANEAGMKELSNILEGLGYSDKEAESIFLGKEDE